MADLSNTDPHERKAQPSSLPSSESSETIEKGDMSCDVFKDVPPNLQTSALTGHDSADAVTAINAVCLKSDTKDLFSGYWTASSAELEKYSMLLYEEAGRNVAKTLSKVQLSRHSYTASNARLSYV